MFFKFLKVKSICQSEKAFLYGLIFILLSETVDVFDICLIVFYSLKLNKTKVEN